jgi:hypothetical protein
MARAGALMNDDHRSAALAYLAETLKAAAPADLTLEATFTGEPLEREGAMSVFSFDASLRGDKPERYWVVAGETEPNYYPHWGLTAEQAYDLHLGTRFMLVVGVSAIPVEELGDDAAESVISFIGSVAPGEPVGDIEPAVAFAVEDGAFAVFRARIRDEEVYVLGLDCPPAIYSEAELPPHVILRRHLGVLIREEARREASEKRRNRA